MFGRQPPIGRFDEYAEDGLSNGTELLRINGTSLVVYDEISINICNEVLGMD